MKMRMSRENLIFIKIKAFYRFLFKINILYTGLKTRKKESVKTPILRGKKHRDVRKRFE